MTVICAYTDGVHTWIGGDTCGIATGGIPMDVGKKWQCAHGWGFGHCGDAFVADLFEEHADALFTGLAKPSEFIRRVREMYERAGMKAVYRDGEAVGNWQNSGILACAGSVWDIDGALAVTPIPANVLHARGSAGVEAKCAAWGYGLAKPQTSPVELIDIALRCAIEFDVNIRGKWQATIFRGMGFVDDFPDAAEMKAVA